MLRQPWEKISMSSAASSGLPTLSRYRVLVVDDDPVQREVLVAHLENWGVSASQASNGYEALNMINRNTGFRLILTDLQMPVMDGLKLIRTIKREKRGKIYSIMMSGLGDRHSVQQALDAGANDYLQKPFHPEQLFARLAALDKVMSLEDDYQQLVRSLFDVMTGMLGSRDNYTLEHSLRVAALSVRIGEKLGIAPEDLEMLELGCLVHDMGKIAIPDDILLKPGRFDAFDRSIMNLHPQIGAHFLSGHYPDERVMEIVLQHHERLDGSGYPQGLKAGKLSPFVMVVSPADTYEALIAERPYKRPISREKALDMLYAEVKKGKLERDAVNALAEVVTTWNPLDIRRKSPEDLKMVESFRRVAYFREPLCSFYNYRYLLALEKRGDHKDNDSFHFIFIDFKNLGRTNARWGYLRTDELLDELGENIQQTLQLFGKTNKDDMGKVLLFRKGADFLIFSTYMKSLTTEILQQVKCHLDDAEKNWGIEAEVILKEFPASQPLYKALDVLLGI